MEFFVKIQATTVPLFVCCHMYKFKYYCTGKKFQYMLLSKLFQISDLSWLKHITYANLKVGSLPTSSCIFVNVEPSHHQILGGLIIIIPIAVPEMFVTA